MSGSGFSIGRLFGIQIQIDWSLLIVFVLVLFNLGAGVFPQWHPDWSPTTNWLTAAAAALSFFASILLHELSHALVARTQRIEIPRITLFLFGGVSQMRNEPPTPKAEFLMAVVGPITSVVLGIVATVLGAWMAGGLIESTLAASDTATLRAAMSGVGPLATLLVWLGPINVMLGLFNIIPGFPLDGGRVLRSLLWWSTGDLLKATQWASFAGRAFAWALMGLGIIGLLGGGSAQGLWLILIGWFLNNAARVSYERLTVKHALHDVPITQVMWTHPETVVADLRLDDFVQHHLMASDQGSFAVEQDGALAGLISLNDVRKVPRDAWGHSTVGDAMTPSSQLATLQLDAGAEQALDELGRRDVDQIPVLDGRRLQGIVRRRDLVRWLAIHGHDAQVR